MKKKMKMTVIMMNRNRKKKKKMTTVMMVMAKMTVMMIMTMAIIIFFLRMRKRMTLTKTIISITRIASNDLIFFPEFDGNDDMVIVIVTYGYRKSSHRETGISIVVSLTLCSYCLIILSRLAPVSQ